MAKKTKKQEFATRLSDIRKDMGLTVNEFAERLGGQPLTARRWESGEGYPSADTLIKLVEIAHVDLHELITGRSTPSADYDRANLNHTKKKFQEMSKVLERQIKEMSSLSGLVIKCIETIKLELS